MAVSGSMAQPGLEWQRALCFSSVVVCVALFDTKGASVSMNWYRNRISVTVKIWSHQSTIYECAVRLRLEIKMGTSKKEKTILKCSCVTQKTRPKTQI